MANRRSALVSLATIAKLTPGDVIHDTTLKGFGARRQKDAVSYFLKTRVDGRQRWFTIGRHGHPWTPESARKRALQILADPTIVEKPSPEAELTVADLAAQFFQSHGPKLKPRTRDEYTRLCRLYLPPCLRQDTRPGPQPGQGVSVQS